jgi:CheY-like chemotaxis protein
MIPLVRPSSWFLARLVGRAQMSNAARTDVSPGVSHKALDHPLYKVSTHVDSLHIIIADDSEDGARSLAILLRLWGVDAEAYWSGPEALKAALADPPDAILSEIRLPGMEGSEFVRRLRGRDEIQETRLVAVTAWADWRSRRRAEEAGFDSFYLKPLDHARLREILAEVRWFKERTNSPVDTSPP